MQPLRDRFPAPAVMGVVNVTPDSFSDGGAFLDPAAAVAHGLQLVADGADLIDVGGESTRPGSDPVPLEVELERVLPVIDGLVRQTDVPISIDTVKAPVAEQAIRAGAGFVNDVSALRHDPEMAEVVAEAGVPVCLMHMLGEPKTMQRDPRYADVVEDVAAFLAERVGLRPVERDRGRPDLRRSGHRLRQDRRAQLDAPAPPRPDRRGRPAAPGRGVAQVVPGPADRRARGGARVCDRRRQPGRGAPRCLDAAGARRQADPAGARRRRGDRGSAVSGPLVEVRGLRVYAFHGVRDFERERGQVFVIDVWLACSPSAAEASDDLADAVNYSAVCDRVAELAAGGPYDLLERLAAVIADALLAGYPVEWVRVRVAKPHAPVKHDVAEVAVTVERGIRTGEPPV